MEFISDSKRILEVLDTKAKMLCLGADADEAFLEKVKGQNPFVEKRGGYSYGAFIELDFGVPVDVPIFNGINKKSPIKIRKKYRDLHDLRDAVVCSILAEEIFGPKNNNFINPPSRIPWNEFNVYENDTYKSECVVLEPPKWYFEKTSNGIPMGRLIQQHGRNQLATAAWSYCELFKTGEQCKFCVIGYNKKALVKKDTKDLAEAVKFAFSQNPNYDLVINSGLIISPSKGSEIIARASEEIKKDCDIKIAAELAPPEKRSYLIDLKNSGIEAVMMNLEVNDERLRRLYCPGKARLIPRDRYIEAFREANDIFGEGNVSSVLLANLENKYSTVDGAKKMIDLGVIPSILVFRGTDGTELENYPQANPEDVKWIYSEMQSYIKDKGLDPSKQVGCTKCGSCSMEGDLYVRRLKFNY